MSSAASRRDDAARIQVRCSLRAGVIRLLALPLLMAFSRAEPQSFAWKQLPTLPDPIGFAGPFAGVSRGALIVAGGANFPQTMPWDGGRKVWYDSVYVLPHPEGNWLTGFHLPHPLGYGVSITTHDGVFCAGGSDAKQHYREVFLIRWRHGAIGLQTLPSLPRPVANSCGAILGRTIYIAGGTESPNATTSLHNFWSLDLNAVRPLWQELEPWPGPPRMFAVAGAAKGSFFLFSGVQLSGDAAGNPVRHYLKDAYRFTPGKGWQRIADLPRAAVAAASPAINRKRQLLVVSGDDGTLVSFEPKTAHPGFPKDVLAYDLRTDNWSRLASAPFSRATVPQTEWQGTAVISNGEARPGYRTPEVWGLKLR